MSKASRFSRIHAVDPSIIYPESDGNPMADNTRQYQYIVTLHTGIASQFAADVNVFVAADLLWYPVEGWPSIRVAPDVMVVFGRPQGHRGSYKQWEEDDIAPQVVFEILSPGNTLREMHDKRKFYELYGVEEYIEYDPDDGTLEIWQRKGRRLKAIAFESEWQSPRLGITLRLEADGELCVFHPDGRKFLTAVELETRAAQAEARAIQERTRAERLAAKLRDLCVDPDKLAD